MDPGLSLFLACIAVISFGLLWFRVRDAVTDLLAYWTPDHSVKLGGSGTSTPIRQIPDTYQLEPPAEPARTSTPEPASNRFADVAYLAGRVEADGSYTYSANKIIDLVGGTRADVLAMIREARDQPDPAPDPSSMLRIRDQSGERLIPR